MVNPTLWLVLLSLPALYSVRTVVGIWMLRRAGLLHWGTLPKVQAKELRRSAAPLTGWNVVGVLHLRVGGLAAYVVLGVTASAPLALPQRLLECAPIIPQALMTVALPLLVRSFCGDTVRYRMVREELLQMVCLVGLLIGNLINLFAPLLASLLGGGSYPNATLLLRIGSLTLIVVLVNALFVNLMIVQGEQGRALKRGLVSLVLNAGLCVGLTLLFGLVGAAWAMAVSELTLTVLMGMLVWKGQERPQVNLAVRYAAVSVIAYIASLLFHPADWEASAVALAVWLLAVPILMKPTLNLMRTAMGDARHSKSAPTADDNLMNPLVAA